MSKEKLSRNFKSKKVCSICGKSPANYQNYDEKYLCIDCMQDNNNDGFLCTKCGERFKKDEEGPEGFCLDCSWKD